MKVLQVISHYVPAYTFGGPLRVAHGLGVALVRAGHQVTVCTTSQKDKQVDLDVPTGRAVDVDGVEVYYEKVNRLRYWGFSFPLARRIQEEALKADVILVHAHYQFANWIGAYWARKYRKPYLIFAHSSLHRDAIKQNRRWEKMLYLSSIERRNLRDADYIVFNAEEELEQSLFSDKGLVIPSGINSDEFMELPAEETFRVMYGLEEKFLVLFLGRLDIQQKGLDVLIQALARVVNVVPEMHVVMAGPDESDAMSLLSRMAEKYGVSRNITFTGLISGSEKKAALQDADVFILPSRSEGLSIALLEAMYMKLPVVTTNRVGLWRAIRREKLGWVVSLDEAELANALLQAARSDDLQEIGERAHRFVWQYHTWDAIAENLIVVMQNRIRGFGGDGK